MDFGCSGRLGLREITKLQANDHSVPLHIRAVHSTDPTNIMQKHLSTSCGVLRVSMAPVITHNVTLHPHWGVIHPNMSMDTDIKAARFNRSLPCLPSIAFACAAVVCDFQGYMLVNSIAVVYCCTLRLFQHICNS